eukprot:10693591-Alexandrium_andersonii.AAC.1
MSPWTDWRPTSGRGISLGAAIWRPGLLLASHRCEAGLPCREALRGTSRRWIVFLRDGIGATADSLLRSKTS